MPIFSFFTTHYITTHYMPINAVITPRYHQWWSFIQKPAVCKSMPAAASQGQACWAALAGTSLQSAPEFIGRLAHCSPVTETFGVPSCHYAEICTNVIIPHLESVIGWNQENNGGRHHGRPAHPYAPALLTQVSEDFYAIVASHTHTHIL